MLQPDRPVNSENLYGILKSMQEKASESPSQHRNAFEQQLYVIEQLAEYALEQSDNNLLSISLLEAIIHWVEILMLQPKLRKEVFTRQGRLDIKAAYGKFIAQNQSTQSERVNAPHPKRLVHGVSECWQLLTSAETFRTLSPELLESIKKIAQALFITDLTPACIQDIQVDIDGKVKALHVNPSQIKAVNQKSTRGFLPFASGLVAIIRPQPLVISLKQPTTEPPQIRLSIKEMQIKMRQGSLDHGIVEYLLAFPDQVKNLLNNIPTIGHIGVARRIKQAYQVG
jgi:hypothetical protein